MGYTLYLPDEETYLSTKDELLVELCSLLGGRAAEQLVFGTVTTGASNDIQRATALARNMVALYGMSEELGLMAPAVVAGQYLDNQAHLDCSEATAALVDSTVRKIIDQSYTEAKKVLEENRALLDEVADYLLLKETITGEDLMAFIEKSKNGDAPAPEEAPTEE